MKSKPVRFGRAIVLSMLLITCIVSLMIGERGQQSIWNDVHIWSSALLLTGAAVHLGTNWDWVKSVFSRPASELKQRIRNLRRTDLWLFISGGLCTIAGLAWLVPGKEMAVVERWAGLHRLAGMIMILVMVIHLLQHWNWMVQTARWMRDTQQPESDDRFGEAQA